MKKIFTLSGTLFLLSTALVAQPVLKSTMSQPPVGTVDSIYGSPPGSVSYGSGGAGVTWNLSGLAPYLQGYATVVSPASTPYHSSFPNANFVLQLTSGIFNYYDYDKISSTGWETQASSYNGPGTGSDYTPNPESDLEFPFNYTASFIDTFQKVGGSANTVPITYDGYGTLITPFGTYANVVRVYKYYGPGDYNYKWYSTSPYLFIIASYDASSNYYTLIGNGTPSGVKQVATENLSVNVYPNPVYEKATIKVDAPNGLNNASFILTDVMGKTIKELKINALQTTLETGNIAPGIYFYRLSNEGHNVAFGKLSIQ